MRRMRRAQLPRCDKLVAAGGDRQDLHERIRQQSHAAGAAIKNEGKPNDLIERLAADDAFANVDFEAAMEPTQFVGRAPQQVDDLSKKLSSPSGNGMTRAKGCRRK